MRPPEIKLPLFVEELNSLSVQYSALIVKNKTSATSTQLAMIKQRAIKLRLKLNTLGKNYNLILVTFCLNDDNLVIPYTDIHMEDAKVIFNELNISKYGGKAINITFYEFNPGISKALEFIFK